MSRSRPRLRLVRPETPLRRRVRDALWHCARWLAWPVSALLTRRARHALALQPAGEVACSEFERRRDDNPWRVDFVCPRCDQVVGDSDELWTQLRRSRRDTVGREMSFTYMCGDCGNRFRVTATSVLLFSSSQVEYLPARTRAASAGWRVVDRNRS